MQFIEKNSFNVRSAVYRLEKTNEPLRFALFPMVHVGSRQFYYEIQSRLTSCDLIIVEGVRSKRASLLTLSYRIIRRIKRMDLVTQQECLDLSGLSEKLVQADIAGDAFDQRWKGLPMTIKIFLLFFIPFYVVYLLLFGTRNLIAENLTTDDLASRDEVLNYDEDFARMDSLLIDERDRILIRKIEDLLREKHSEPRLVGIVYGAQHMRNIALFLSEKLGYRIIGAEWVTVFDL
jgi:hypothetical protein